jgi:very-short-patch-repair endonuclease
MRGPVITFKRARRLRRDMSLPEVVLWQALRRLQVGLHFRRQHPIGPYILDFYCAAAKLAVEVDGPAHDGRQMQDERRTNWLATEGIRVLRFTTEDVETRPAIVLSAITRAAPPSKLR